MLPGIQNKKMRSFKNVVLCLNRNKRAVGICVNFVIDLAHCGVSVAQ